MPTSVATPAMDQSPPFDPQPWDDPEAADRGRQRFAAQQDDQTPIGRPYRVAAG